MGPWATISSCRELVAQSGAVNDSGHTTYGSRIEEGGALMASLFALGVMSLAWMAFVAALIALEKTLPWGRAVTYGTASLLLVLGVVLIAAPDAVPGLMVPGGGETPAAMPMR